MHTDDTKDQNNMLFDYYGKPFCYHRSGSTSSININDFTSSRYLGMCYITNYTVDKFCLHEEDKAKNCADLDACSKAMHHGITLAATPSHSDPGFSNISLVTVSITYPFCIVISLEDIVAVREMRRLASKSGTDKRDALVYHKRPSLSQHLNHNDIKYLFSYV